MLGIGGPDLCLERLRSRLQLNLKLDEIRLPKGYLRRAKHVCELPDQVLDLLLHLRVSVQEVFLVKAELFDQLLCPAVRLLDTLGLLLSGPPEDVLGRDDLSNLSPRPEHLVPLEVEKSHLGLVPVHSRYRSRTAQARSLDWLKQCRGRYPAYLDEVDTVGLHQRVLL